MQDCMCVTNATEGTEGDMPLNRAEIDEIERIDTVRSNHETQDIAAGPALITSVACPHKDDKGKACGYVNEDAMNWSFDYFFGSSLPMSETANS